MTYRIEWTRQSLKDLRKLDKSTSNRIIAGVEVFAETGRGDVKRLTNANGQYRLRIGDWRVRFVINSQGSVQIMAVLRVLPRGQAYRDM